MLTMDVAFDSDWIRELQEAAAMFPDVVESWWSRDVVPYAVHFVDKTLRVAPPRRYVDWSPFGEATSEAQRLFVIATILRDENGEMAPYQRADEMIHGWHVATERSGGISGLLVYHDDPRSIYVYGDASGDHQQQFHVTTGWPTFVQVMQAMSLDVYDWMEQGWVSVVDEMVWAAQGGGR